MTSQQSSSRPLRWLAVLMATGTLGIMTVGINASFAPSCTILPVDPAEVWINRFLMFPWVIFTIVGCLIVFYRPQNRIGWLSLVIGMVGASLFSSRLYLDCIDKTATFPKQFLFLAWLNHAGLTFVLLVTFFALLPMLFPTGRFLSPRWRNASVGVIGVGAIAQLIVALSPQLSGSPFSEGLNIANPIAAVPASWIPLAANITFSSTILACLLGIVTIIVRFRRARGDEKQQLKWLTYFVGSFVAIQALLFEWIGDGYFKNNPQAVATTFYQIYQFVYSFIVLVVFNGLPLVIGLTVFKFRLYDIDIIIRRTLQYAIMTGLLALVYFGSVILLQTLVENLTGSQSPAVIVISTLAIAALFNPLRIRVQDFIDRRFFRKKYDAEQALAQFAAVSRDEVDMQKLTDALLDVIEETLQPEQASLWLKINR